MLFLSVFPLGYLLLSLIRSEKGGFNSLDFFLRMPVYLAVGMAGYVVILFLVGHLLFNLYVILLLFGLFWFIFLYKQKAWIQLRQLNLSKSLSGLSEPVKLGLVLLSLFSLCHFVFIAYSMGGWCPPGDCIWHAMWVSLIKKYQNIAPPNISSPWNVAFGYYYPRGFHIISAVASLLTNVYPGEAVLIAATGISILIPLMLYTMVYTKTKSNFFSFIAFLMAFIVPGGNPYPMRSYSLFASYLQGVYPSLFGILLTITFFCLVTCFGDSPKRFVFQSRRHAFLILILAFAIVVTHYSFFPLVALYLIVRMLFSHRSKLKRFLLSKKSLFVSALALLFFLLCLPQISLLYFNVRSSVLNFAYLEAKWLVSFWIPFSFFYSNVNGVLIVATFLLTLIFLVYREFESIGLLYLCFAIPLILSTSYEFYVNFLWFLMPFRVLIAFIAFSYVVFAILLHSISIRLMEKKRNTFFIMRKNRQNLSGSKIRIYVLTIILFAPLIYGSFASYSPSTSGRPLGDDYDALVWIDKNVAPEDLILNDRSMIGLFLPSFSIKNVVFLPEADWPNKVLNRMRECFSIFDDPANTTYINATLEKYNIKYIFISSSDYYYDFWHGYEYSPPLVYRPYNASQILYFFDHNSALYQEFRRECVGVYSVELF